MIVVVKIQFFYDIHGRDREYELEKLKRKQTHMQTNEQMSVI